ncbi:MAG: hypothetical protein QOG90_494 [Actinomycetota bacterium]|jgi:sugar phosphate isomerase/epimerase
MGVIRKTASISTLGLVNFRSKKEKLQRAERRFDAEHLARSVAESGFTKVEKELRRLSGNEAKAAKQLARLRRSRKVRRAETLTSFLSTAQPVVKDGMQSALSTASDLGAKGAKRGRKAAKVARATAKDLRASAEQAVDNARSALGT